MAFAGHFAALRSLRDEFNNIRANIEGLPRTGQPLPESKPQWDLLPRIDWFWVKVGIKGALAATISVVLLLWINPPGPAALTLMAWTMTLFGRPYIRSGGTGDLRAFQNGFKGSLALIGCAIVLLLTTPYLSNYIVMNLVLFAILFAFGYCLAKIGAITFWIQMALLTISTFVGLDPQHPVPSLTIIETFLGMIAGLAIATVVGQVALAHVTSDLAQRRSTCSLQRYERFTPARTRSGESSNSVGDSIGRSAASGSPDS